jgi:hypothetical protein
MAHASDASVLDVGRKTRTISTALRRALTNRDRGCRFPGCGSTHCDAHHLVHWANGGETSLENTLLLCRRHHRLVHEEGFQLKRLPEGEVEFRNPHGLLVPAAPAPPRSPIDPVEALVRRLEDGGVVVDPYTGTPLWDGTAPDLGLAVEYLLNRNGRTRVEEGNGTADEVSLESRAAASPEPARPSGAAAGPTDFAEHAASSEAPGSPDDERDVRWEAMIRAALEQAARLEDD